MKIFNTLTRRKEEFVPLEPGKVKMYVCGPTVYNYIHIGNARPMIVFDTVRRYFEYKGYEVNYVSNFTDVDDKIIKKALEEGVDSEVISSRYIEECKKDMEGMNVKPATVHPKATLEIEGMLEMIQVLIDKGHAYAAPDGTVYFRTSSFKDYGKLSHKNLEELQSGFREIKVTGEKKTRRILFCGSLRRRESLFGSLSGVRGVQDGILSVRLWPRNTWEIPSIFTQEGKIWFFHTTKMRLPSQKQPAGSLLPGIGCTMPF